MNKNVETVISEAILSLGISPDTKGFHYIRRGVIMYVSKSEDDPDITRHIYREIADYFRVSESSVERAIRRALQSGWYKRNADFAREVFLNLLQNKSDVPYNTMFITALGEWTRRKFKL